MRDRVNQNDDAGFTIAITPSADMPAPVAEIVVYGYVKGDVIYDLDGNFNKFSFSMPGQDRFDENDDEFVFLHANQSRFGIKSKVDTAVGQIRSRIEMDFFCAGEATDFGAAFQGIGQTYCPRLRQAYGEWDMTPNWTFLAGQTDQIETLSIIGVTLVDISRRCRHQRRHPLRTGPLDLSRRPPDLGRGDGAAGRGERHADPGRRLVPAI